MFLNYFAILYISKSHYTLPFLAARINIFWRDYKQNVCIAYQPRLIVFLFISMKSFWNHPPCLFESGTVSGTVFSFMHIPIVTLCNRLIINYEVISFSNSVELIIRIFIGNSHCCTSFDVNRPVRVHHCQGARHFWNWVTVKPLALNLPPTLLF